MEYCEAGSLETIYKRIKVMNGRTGEKVLGKIAESVRRTATFSRADTFQVLMGLVYLHDRKIIHRGEHRCCYGFGRLADAGSQTSSRRTC